MSTATPSAPPAAEIYDPLNVVLDPEETAHIHRLMAESDKSNPRKAAHHAAAARFALHLKETGQLPA